MIKYRIIRVGIKRKAVCAVHPGTSERKWMSCPIPRPGELLNILVCNFNIS